MTSLTRRFALATMVLALGAGGAGAARADIVDFTAQGTFFTEDPRTFGGLTATAGAGQFLFVAPATGLGVLGGQGNQYIDTSESVLFEFASGAATDVSFTRLGAVGGSNTSMNLEGFGVGGGSLGIVAFSPVTASIFDVSARFGGVALSGFRIAGNGQVSGVAIRTVSFTTAAAVPEASTLAMGGLVALVGLVVARRRGRAA
jgi:hypothetical protein